MNADAPMGLMAARVTSIDAESGIVILKLQDTFIPGECPKPGDQVWVPRYRLQCTAVAGGDLRLRCRLDMHHAGFHQLPRTDWA